MLLPPSAPVNTRRTAATQPPSLPHPRASSSPRTSRQANAPATEEPWTTPLDPPPPPARKPMCPLHATPGLRPEQEGAPQVESRHVRRRGFTPRRKGTNGLVQ